MKDLTTLELESQKAVERETQQFLDRVYELEAILGIPHSSSSMLPTKSLRRRVKNLRAQAARRINPDDPEVQQLPILYGEYKTRKASPVPFAYGG